jgi:CDP-4-dehydro-6-deoxyglucose reductase/ferredoxin-NAD(P)+ reductase (naphthalene dioxygenase ferredoxin-specific)
MALIHIADWQQPIEAGRRRILEAALDAGVPFPHGCGSGECGSCKCQLIEGEVTSDAFSPDALSSEEVAQRLILACRARPAGDVRIRWLAAGAAKPVVKVSTRVASMERAAHDVVVLTLALPAGGAFDFQPGQFAKLRFDTIPERSYSMASQPGEGHLTFHIRVLPEGRASTHVNSRLAIGDEVQVHGPFGDAIWQGPTNDPLVLVAGGTGLAPILSILDAALVAGQAAEQIHLYHGVRSESDLYAGDLLRRRSREQGFRFAPVYSSPAGTAVRPAHVHEAVAEHFEDLSRAMVYTSGPPMMVDAVKGVALRRGAARERIRADAFFSAEPEKRSLWRRISGSLSGAK